MRKALIVILAVLAVMLSAEKVLLNSPWLTERLVRRFFLRSAPSVRLKDFKITAQKYFWPAHFEFIDIKLGIELNGKRLSLACSRLELDFVVLRRRFRQFDVWIDSTQVIYGPGKAQDVRAELKVFFDREGGLLVHGPLSAQVLAWDRAGAEHVSAEFLADGKGLYFDRLKGGAFDGAFTGRADIFFAQPPVYSVRLLVKDMEAERLSAFTPQVADKVSGRIAGEMRFGGAGDRLTDFWGELSMPRGGRVDASFLANLTQYVPTLSNYLPSSKEKARFEALIRSGGKLKVERLSVSMRNDSQRHLTAGLSLASKEANLNWDLSYDISVDGTWDDLLKSWQAMFR